MSQIRAEETTERTSAGASEISAPGTGWRRIPLPSASTRERAPAAVQRRGDERTELSLRIQRLSIDAARDPVTGELFYDFANEDETTNLSRRGLCIRCERPPEIGTRVLVQLRLPGEAPVDVVGLARWSRVAYVPGEHGARAVALVGLELLGGAPRALERYDRALGQLARGAASTDDANLHSAVASPGDRR
jgi:hypothetical protein